MQIYACFSTLRMLTINEYKTENISHIFLISGIAISQDAIERKTFSENERGRPRIGNWVGHNGINRFDARVEEGRNSVYGIARKLQKNCFCSYVSKCKILAQNVGALYRRSLDRNLGDASSLFPVDTHMVIYSTLFIENRQQKKNSRRQTCSAWFLRSLHAATTDRPKWNFPNEGQWFLRLSFLDVPTRSCNRLLPIHWLASAANS